MLRHIASAVVIAVSICAQANAVEIRADQPCVIRHCAEYIWGAYHDGETDYYDEQCTRWETRLDARCASMQPLPNGIKLPPPREIQVQPGSQITR